MRILICGSRSWSDIHAIRMRLIALPPNSTIIHGAAPGADTIAGWLAGDFGFTVHAFPADWKKHGKAAGPIRNRQMLDEKPDLVLAYWDGTSIGTSDCITEARKRGIPVEIHKAETDVSH